MVCTIIISRSQWSLDNYDEEENEFSIKIKWTQAACASTTPISQAYEGECAGILKPKCDKFMQN